MSNQAHEDTKNVLMDEFDHVVDGLMADDDWSEVHSAIDYNGGWHEAIVDRDYSPREAIDVLEEYREYEETDSGLWQGAGSWDRILATIAAYTFSNACYAEANFIYTDLLDEYQWLVGKDCDEDGISLPVDDEGDYLDPPWFEDRDAVYNWAQKQLKAM